MEVAEENERTVLRRQVTFEDVADLERLLLRVTPFRGLGETAKRVAEASPPPERSERQVAGDGE
jgi:hypothetical protein